MRRIRIPADTVGPVSRGHPWVYDDGLSARPQLGEPVQLVDAKDRPVAWGLGDEPPIVVRVMGFRPEPMAAFVRRRVAAALDRRRLVGGATDAWRLLHGEGDGVGGLVVDRYADLAVVRLYARAWEPHLDLLVTVLRETGLFTKIYRRFGVERVDGRDGGRPLWGGEPPDALVVQEHGMRLLVRPKVGQKTGMFLDQREHRRLVRGWASGRSVLNLFSYNGGFSVAAALGGATRVTSVDLAEPALEDARENFRLNGLDPAAHAFVATDAFAWKGEGADLVVVDPPSLSHAQKADGAARAAYKQLHRQLGPRVGSLLCTSSCSARLSWERWEEAVREGLGAGWSALHRSAEPVDHPVALGHPEGRYLKFLLLGRLG